MITAHKNNHRNHRLPASTKRTIGLKAIKDHNTVTKISKEHGCSQTTVYAQKDKALSAVNQAWLKNRLFWYTVANIILPRTSIKLSTYNFIC